MSIYENLDLLIRENIKPNGNREITGQILQETLLEMVNSQRQPEELLWSELYALKNAKELTPGRLYRITDYITTTTQENTQSAGHQFDVIVLALTNDTLAERAWACHHEGDTYFQNSHLEAWQIRYCLDNDTSRFDWAVPTSSGGKGVIYRMIDEHGNDCPYDFKNIQFKHPNNTTDNTYYYTFSTVLSEVVTDHSFNGAYCNKNEIGVYVTNQKQYLNRIVFINTSKTSACYANSFGNYCHSNSFGNSCYYNSFDTYCYKNSFGNSCYYNSFGNYCNSNSFGNECHSNSFGNYCYSNSFDNNCYSNSFDNSCYYNSFGNYCNSNSFGGSCYSNSFDTYCYKNSFGNECHSNSFGNYCYFNSFGNNCYSNSFGNNCYSNSFDNNCYSNSFANYCNSNSFGNYCHSNSFANNCYSNSFDTYCYKNSFDNKNIFNSFGNACYSNSFGTYCRYNKVDDGVSVILNNSETASSNQQVQNYHLTSGLTSKTIEVERNRAYQTTVAIDSSGNVKQFCIADIIQ